LKSLVAGDTGIAAFLSFRPLFEHQDPGAQIVRRDSNRSAGAAESHDDHVRFAVPFIVSGSHGCLMMDMSPQRAPGARKHHPRRRGGRLH
jgi:hypothetical protein